MASKNRQLIGPGIGLIALTVVGILDFSAASASVGSSNFGVRSVNIADQAITGYSGSVLGAPGDGETPGGGEVEVPANCYAGADPAGGFAATDITPTGQGNYYSPQYISAQDTSGFSPWVDEVLAADGDFSFGAGKVTIDRVVVDGRTLTAVDITDLVNLSGASAIPAGTVSKSSLPSWWTAAQKSVADYGLIKLDRALPVQTEMLSIIDSAAFRDRIGASASDYIEATDLTVSYPLTIEWNDANGSCQEKSVDFSFGWHFGAE